MKKTWVKRENLFYKPFYKQKTKMTLLAIIILGLIFFVYQAVYINHLPITSTPFNVNISGLYQESTTSKTEEIKIIRGIRLRDYDLYKPTYDNLFKCLDGSKLIPFHQLNDNYCDCVKDGSDETSTNACIVGKFYCKYQKRHITGRGLDVFISSSRINDGICDCCDGSDEWTTSISCKNQCSFKFT